MKLFLFIILTFSVLALLSSYIFYPVWLSLVSRKRKLSLQSYSADDPDLPDIYILMAVYNEADVIGKKLESIRKTDYPIEKIHIRIGSDLSDDGTDEIIKEFDTNGIDLQLKRFDARRGKAPIVVDLFEELKSSGSNLNQTLLVLTDANVLFDEKTLFELARFFKEPKTGLVGARFKNLIASAGDEIAQEESNYISMENRLKYQQGLMNGQMIGAFGGCYAIRPDYFSRQAANYIMEDFFISMSCILRGGKTYLNKEAICYEDLPGEIAEEYKRKKRIARGNVQNLRYFFARLFGRSAFWHFLVYKVFRWMGPLFLFLIALCSAILCSVFGNYWAGWMFVLITGLLVLSCIDWGLAHLKIKIPILRKISYWFWMNVALAHGFLEYVLDNRQGTWQPPKRKLNDVE